MDAWESKENIQIYLLVTGDEALVKKLGRSSRLFQNSQTLHKSWNMLYCFTIVTCLFGIFISHSSASTVLSYLVQVKEWYCNLKSHRFFCSRKEKIDKSGRASQVQIKENGLGRREGVSTVTLAFVGQKVFRLTRTWNSEVTVNCPLIKGMAHFLQCLCMIHVRWGSWFSGFVVLVKVK